MTTIYERIAASVPANRQTAISGAGTSKDPALTDAQKREDLLTHLARIEAQILTSEGRARRMLGRQKFDIQQQLSALRPKHRRPSYVSYFHEVARQMLLPATFRMICEKAHQLAIEDEAKHSDSTDGK